MVVDEDDDGFVLGGLVFVDHRVCGDDDFVAGLDASRRGAVERDFARGAIDDIGREACAVGDVIDIDAFPRDDMGAAAQIGIDRNRPLVVEVGTSHRRAVNLRF